MAMTRREFVRRETEALGRFLSDTDTNSMVGWWRTYRCDCGFTCTSAGDIFDHRCASQGETPETGNP